MEQLKVFVPLPNYTCCV